jgi:hypothetical protein
MTVREENEGEAENQAGDEGGERPLIIGKLMSDLDE